MSKYGGFSGPYFPVFGLNTGKYGPENTPYLDTFHAVSQLTLETNEEQVMHLKSDDMEVKTSDNANEVIEKNFQLLSSRYQTGLGTSMRGSDFIFDGLNLLYCKCHKINFKHEGLTLHFNVALNVLYENEMKICLAYISKEIS